MIASSRLEPAIRSTSPIVRSSVAIARAGRRSPTSASRARTLTSRRRCHRRASCRRRLPILAEVQLPDLVRAGRLDAERRVPHFGQATPFALVVGLQQQASSSRIGSSVNGLRRYRTVPPERPDLALPRSRVARRDRDDNITLQRPYRMRLRPARRFRLPGPHLPARGGALGDAGGR